MIHVPPGGLHDLIYAPPGGAGLLIRPEVVFTFLFFLFFLSLLFLLDVFTSGFWKDLSAVEDESLKELASGLEATVLASRAPGTTDAYRGSFARWKKVCKF